MRRTRGDDRSAKNSNNTAKKQITDGSGGIAMVALTCFGPSLACSKVAPKAAVRFFISAVQFPAYTRRSLASETPCTLSWVAAGPGAESIDTLPCGCGRWEGEDPRLKGRAGCSQMGTVFLLVGDMPSRTAD